MGHQAQTGDGPQLERAINLPGAVALVVGAVVGAGIFVQVKPIAEGSGAAIWLAFTAAILMSIFGVIPIIELAGAMPRAGAGFLFVSRLLSPCAGWLTSWWLVLGGGASTTVVALTLAKYLPVGLPDHAVAAGVLLVFYGVYQLGMRLAMSLQIIFAAQFVFALVLYGVVGMLHVELDIAAVPDAGAGPFFAAVLLAYATCMGFQVIAEMGEEIKNARRNIPLALILGGAAVAVIYVLVGQVYVSSAPLHDAADFAAFSQPLTDSATPFLSRFWVRFLAVGAITAGLTSLNAAAIALPREFFAQARDGVVPACLGRVSARTRTPNNAVTFYFAFVLLLIALGRDVDFYGLAAAIGILGVSSVLCFAALRLPGKFPERHAGAFIRFPRPVLGVCTAVTVLVSLAMGSVLALERPAVVGLYALWTLMVLVLYVWRTRRFGEPDWARFRKIPGSDEE